MTHEMIMNNINLDSRPEALQNSVCSSSPFSETANNLRAPTIQILPLHPKSRPSTHSLTMTDWQGLPFELQADILKLCIPRLDDSFFRWSLAATHPDMLTTKDVDNYIEQHAKQEHRVFVKLFTVCKAWSRILSPAVHQHFKDVNDYRTNQLDPEIQEVREQQNQGFGSLRCGCSPRTPTRVECFEKWRQYLSDRCYYLRRLTRHFSDPDIDFKP